MKTLKLTLKKEWFDMILSGEKYQEYREIKPYWIKRIAKGWNFINADLTLWEQGNEMFEPVKFDAVEFTNGYSKDSRMVTKECQGIDIGVGLYILGANNQPCFRIKLGKEVCRLNC